MEDTKISQQIIDIKDANGKTFSCNISDICDINGDISDKKTTNITDNVNIQPIKLHDIEYVDQNGNVLDSLQLLKDVESGKTNILALDVEMEATHSGKNHNHCIYYEDSMEKDAETFLNPFKKPLLKNHDSYSEPLGRTFQAWFGPSILTDERSAIHLKVRVTDKDAIPKFLDGRYSTVSIGGSMGTVTCNICGKTILKDGKFNFCGHWRGETYKNQLCYWGARDIKYHEVSTVNNPADDFAQIIKVTVVTDSDDKKQNDNNKEEKVMSDKTKEKTTDSVDINQAVSKISDMIDDLLSAVKPKDSTSTEDTTEKDSVNTTEEVKPEDTTDSKETDSNKELEAIKTQLTDANTKIANLEKELADAKSEIEKNKTEAEDAKKEIEAYKDKCITLATANKELLADSVLSKEIVAGKITNETKDARKEELMAMSAKDLNKLSKENIASNANKEQRVIPKVTSPVLAQSETTNDSNGSADTNKSKTNDNTGKSTVDDFAQDIVGKFFK